MLNKDKLVLCLVIILMLVFSGVSSAADQKEIVVAMAVSPTHIMFDVLNRLKAELEEKSNGEIFVRILGSEIGGERDMMEGVTAGEYHIGLGGSMPMNLYAPEFAAADIPFALPSKEAAKAIYKGELGSLINDRFIENGKMRLGGISARNPRCLTANVPAKTPEDIAGIAMRVPEIDYFVRIWKQIGVLPAAIAWPEVFLSLQTGVIDMEENPNVDILAGNLYEVQDYVIKTNHIYSFWHWLVNEDFYNSLSGADKELIFGTLDEVIAWGEEYVESLSDEAWASLEEKGMKIIEPDSEAFIKKAVPEIINIADELHPKVKEYILSFVKDYL